MVNQEKTLKSDVDDRSEALPAASIVLPEGQDVLVAIPTLNEADHIETCIRSLMDGDQRIRNARFIIIDGGSTDETCAKVSALTAEFPNLEVMRNPKRLQSAGINLVAREKGEGRHVLVRCDAHASYPRNYVMAIADTLVRLNVESVATPMDAVGTTCFQRANAAIVDTPLGSGGSAHRGGKVSKFVDHGHHAGFNLRTFLALNGYDESFSHNEDGEYDVRLGKAGGRIWLDANIRMSYAPRADVSALARQYYNYGRGRARTLIKHSHAPRLRQMIPQAVLASCLVGIAAAPINPMGLALPAAYVAVLAAASLAMAIKMRSACGLLAGLASAAMHMPWALGFIRQSLSPIPKAEPIPHLQPATQPAPAPAAQEATITPAR